MPGHRRETHDRIRTPVEARNASLVEARLFEERPARGLQYSAFDLIAHAVRIDDLSAIHGGHRPFDADIARITHYRHFHCNRKVRHQILVLSEGDASAVGNRSLVSAGTGVGEAILVWVGKMHIPMASEGGHCDFAPRNELEIDLLRYLQRELNGRVSFERVVSGIGLKNIYSFLRDEKGMKEPSWLKDRMYQEDPNAVIGEVGEDGSNELCAKALDMFASAYGAEAGNLALKVLSVGGLYLGGGIAPKILKTMKNGTFMQAFTDKGRLSDLLIHMPVRIILESRAALMGAAAYAEARAAQISGQSVRAASVQFS